MAEEQHAAERADDGRESRRNTADADARATVIAIVRGIVIGSVILATWLMVRPDPPTARSIREQLFEELQPVTLANCTLERIGSRNDGGYLMCANLLGNVRSAYSYGIAGDDNWGCQISQRFGVPVHQYDCFDPTRPQCPGGQAIFHDECVGPRAEHLEGRAYDSVPNQVAKNGDAGKTLVVKMDVEGAELDSLMATPDSLLETIDQLVMELHSADQPYLDLVRKLKRTFHPVHIHYNNSRCTTMYKPFPSPVYEVLFVNRRVGKPVPGAPPPRLPHALDAVNNTFRTDCQTPIL
jgi:hypothetical protein